MSDQDKPVVNRARQEARRRFLRSLMLAGGVLGASMLGIIPVMSRAQPRLRPPGALAEQEFLAACIKCGQCVQVCPVEAIVLAELGDGFGIGAPLLNARDQACDFSCDGLQCVLACPTGALTHELNFAHQVTMGIAKVVAPERCLAVMGKGLRGLARGADYTGKLRYDQIDRWNPIPVRDHSYDLELCDLCVRQCPIEIRMAQCASGKPPSGDTAQCPPKHAIALERDGAGRMVPIVKDGCVGCGVCEMICPAEPAAIVIESDRLSEAV